MKALGDNYPCSGCGACCRRVNKAVQNIGIGATDPDSELYFPYKWDDTGRCEKLTEDNKCMVYESRPLICDVDRIMKLISIPRDLFFAANIEACNAMMNEEGLPIHLRIKY